MEEVKKEREAFERWFEPDDDNRRAVVQMRSGDRYVDSAMYLNACWEGWQAASAGKADLLDALRGLLPVTFTGNPTRAEEVAHWTREHELGNGQAAAVLAAYAAISKVTGSAA